MFGNGRTFARVIEASNERRREIGMIIDTKRIFKQSNQLRVRAMVVTVKISRTIILTR
jgi:hypothetical protein